MSLMKTLYIKLKHTEMRAVGAPTPGRKDQGDGGSTSREANEHELGFDGDAVFEETLHPILGDSGCSAIVPFAKTEEAQMSAMRRDLQRWEAEHREQATAQELNFLTNYGLEPLALPGRPGEVFDTKGKAKEKGFNPYRFATYEEGFWGGGNIPCLPTKGWGQKSVSQPPFHAAKRNAAK